MAVEPKNFGFGEDETMLRDSARKFMSDHCSTDKLHSLVASDYQIDRDNLCLWDQSLWQQIVELGWPAVCVPEANGGIGMPLVAAVALAEEIGKAGFPSPLLGIFNSTFVLRACDSAAAHQALASIAGGKTMTLAITNAAGSWHSDHTDVEVCTYPRYPPASRPPLGYRRDVPVITISVVAGGHRPPLPQGGGLSPPFRS